MSYKWCMVPECKNTSIKAPNKLFVHVPYEKKIRYQWLTLARRDPTLVSLKSPIYFCEDHFDLPNDMENYMEYHVMGSVSVVRMKPGCLPTKFEYKLNDSTPTSKEIDQSYSVKKRRLLVKKENEEELEDKNVTKYIDSDDTSSAVSNMSSDATDESIGDDARINRCLFCGLKTSPTVKRKGRPLRSFQLTRNYLATKPQVVVYAQDIFNRIELSEHEKICRPCTQRADRYYSKKQKETEARNINKCEVVIKMEPLDETTDDPLNIVEEPIKTEVKIERENNDEAPCQAVPKIAIPGYKRLSCTTTHCLMKDCANTDVHRINVLIRMNILCTQNVYIPRGTRMCGTHLTSVTWQNITDHCRNIYDTFTGSQISEMLNMLKDRNGYQLNFEKLDSIEDSVFEYHTGLSKSKFEKLIETTPSLQDVKKIKTALAAFLCKIHIGESAKRLSWIFRQTPGQFSCMVSTVKSRLGHFDSITEIKTQLLANKS